MTRLWRLAAVGLATLPVTAGAEGWPIPWDGFWRSEHESCAHAARHAGPVITSETRCQGLSALAQGTPSSWLVQMRCDDEGRIWTAPRLVMLDEDRMWVWFGPGGLGPILLLRCEGSEEY